jgi:glycosyltransferase involved in cell wall biosynthesis
MTMKLSVIIATRNRADAIPGCLDSIAIAFSNAASVDAEIVIVDNGSSDNTSAVIQEWMTANNVPIKALSEPRKGKARALNLALKEARGQLLAFTDDDCCLHPDYVNDLIRHDAATDELVLRGGRIELGDPTDLPLTINTRSIGGRWNRTLNSARHDAIEGKINGCNMTMRRALFEYLGPFDEDFGPGSYIGSGEDTEYMFRAYAGNVTIEYVPDMAVSHHHGRKTVDVAHKLWRNYTTGNGGIFVKYLLKHPNLCRPFYWDVKNAVREFAAGRNTCLPEFGFSHRDRVKFQMLGAIKYFLRPLQSRQSIKKG